MEEGAAGEKKKESGRVCVTGGSGFLGSWCVKELLQRGYQVNTSVRSESKAAFLKDLEGAAERLTIFPGVDLLEPGSYQECISGCDVVLHTASPFFFVGGSEEALVKPALEGTRNVLTTCKELGVKKVVLTSSMAAIYATYGTLPDDHVYSASTWSPKDVLREKANWYCLSKTVAEELAWEMSKESDCPFQLATINPCLILGPQLPGQAHLNTSSASLLPFFDGSWKCVPNSCRAIVDVRDCAAAHVNAIEHWPEAAGKRFVLVESSPHYKDMAELIRELVPEQLRGHVPTAVSETTEAPAMGNPPPRPILFDNSPSKDILGISYHSTREMIASAIESLLANGFTNSNQYSKDKL